MTLPWAAGEYTEQEPKKRVLACLAAYHRELGGSGLALRTWTCVFEEKRCFMYSDRSLPPFAKRKEYHTHTRFCHGFYRKNDASWTEREFAGA